MVSIEFLDFTLAQLTEEAFRPWKGVNTILAPGQRFNELQEPENWPQGLARIEPAILLIKDHLAKAFAELHQMLRATQHKTLTDIRAETIYATCAHEKVKEAFRAELRLRLNLREGRDYQKLVSQARTELDPMARFELLEALSIARKEHLNTLLSNPHPAQPRSTPPAESVSFTKEVEGASPPVNEQIPWSIREAALKELQEYAGVGLTLTSEEMTLKNALLSPRTKLTEPQEILLESVVGHTSYRRQADLLKTMTHVMSSPPRWEYILWTLHDQISEGKKWNRPPVELLTLKGTQQNDFELWQLKTSQVKQQLRMQARKARSILEPLLSLGGEMKESRRKDRVFIDKLRAAISPKRGSTLRTRFNSLEQNRIQELHGFYESQNIEIDRYGAPNGAGKHQLIPSLVSEAVDKFTNNPKLSELTNLQLELLQNLTYLEVIRLCRLNALYRQHPEKDSQLIRTQIIQVLLVAYQRNLFRVKPNHIRFVLRFALEQVKMNKDEIIERTEALKQLNSRRKAFERFVKLEDLKVSKMITALDKFKNEEIKEISTELDSEFISRQQKVDPVQLEDDLNQ